MTYLVRCDTQAGCGKTYPADLSNCPHCGAMFALSSPEPIDDKYWTYDIETYPNVFTATFIHVNTSNCIQFEISQRRNDHTRFVEFILGLSRCGAVGVGYNNQAFDYPVIHNLPTTPAEIYEKAMRVIRAENKWEHVVWDNEQLFPQLDLYKIHHFDNKAKATSLKALEFAMRSRDVRDLPFPVGTILTDEQIDVLLSYNKHDTHETAKFFVRSLEQIKFREELTLKYNRNFMNHNDTKIGKDFFIMELEKNGVQCFTANRQPRQTIRPSINLHDVVFPYIKFERPEFEEIRQFFINKTITETKGVFTDVHCIVDGFRFDFGTGGIHGSVESQIVKSNDTHVIIDLDVASFYPNLAISNRLYPEHLSPLFCDIYKQVYDTRATYKKGTPENAMLKLALNGVYGDSNNVYSPFYDPKYTMSITINGQLLLCMLVEQLIKIPTLSMIQANTDGITVLCPRDYVEHVHAVRKWREQFTCLQLEEAIYSRMIIANVNNYIAVYESGKLKRKGAYEYVTQWHQDPSALIIPKAAEAALVHGKDIREFITSHRDPFDFMLRAKVPRGSKLVTRYNDYNVEIEQQHITRYYITRTGGSLVKISPPTGRPGTWKRKAGITDAQYAAVMLELSQTPRPDATLDADGTPHDPRIHTGNRSKHETREMGISVGWLTTECNCADDFDWSLSDYEYYISETHKLVDPLL